MNQQPQDRQEEVAEGGVAAGGTVSTRVEPSGEQLGRKLQGEILTKTTGKKKGLNGHQNCIR